MMGPGEIPFRGTDTVVVSRRALVGALVALVGVSMLLAVARPAVPAIFAVPVIVVALSVVPGSLLLLAVADEFRAEATWAVYAIGSSLMLLMLLGLGLNVVGPPLGVDRPLSVGPLVVSVMGLVGVLAILAIANGRASPSVEIDLPRVFSPQPLALALLPFVGIYGVTLLNRTGENGLLVAGLIVIALVPLVVALWVDSTWHGFAVWTMALAVLYHDALFIGRTFPGNAVVVRIFKAGRWTPGIETGGPLSSELLQHGTIFPMYAVLNGLGILDQMVLVNPVFVSVIPVALFVAYREFLDSRAALLAASTFVFAHPFYNQYPTAGRAATPVLFLALFAVTLSQSSFSRGVRSGLAILFLTGVVFTHYGTSYFFLSAVLVASVGYVGIELLDRLLHRISLPRVDQFELPQLDIHDARRSALLTWPLRGYYVTVTFSWYLFTNDARAFALFPRHFSRVLEQFVSGDIGTDVGRTGARLQRDYGSAAIEYSKDLYELLGLVILLGILVTAYYRFFNPDRYRFNDHFFVMGVVMLGLFGLTIVARTWGGGRPMMITFVFTLAFIGAAIEWAAEQFAQRQSAFERWTRSVGGGFTVPIGLFGTMLVLLFVLNSGVATALVLPGSAPSNTPTSSPDPNTATDVAAHAWLLDHGASMPIFGDFAAHGQTDWYAPAIAANTERGETYAGRTPGEVLRLTRPGVQEGYLILLGHNLEQGELNLHLETAPVDSIREVYRRNRIFTTGHSSVYHFDQS